MARRTGARIRFALAIGCWFVAAAAWGQPFPQCTPVTFESGTSEGYTLSGPWHVSTSCGANSGAHSTTNVLYYGSDANCNYDLGTTSGTADSLPTVLPAPAEVRFNSRLQVESDTGFDLVEVQASTDGGGTWTTILDKSRLPNDNAWHPVSGVISGPGSTVQVRFSLDTVDGQVNSTLGWMIDDIQVCYATLPPVPASNHLTLALLAAALSGLAFLAFRRRARAR